MRLVAVLDTNVLLSAVGWKGKPYQCLELARAGSIDAVVCPEILAELTEKLHHRLHFTPDAINATLTDLLSVLTVVRIANQLHGISADPDDDKVLECAVAANATHIVTGDRQAPSAAQPLREHSNCQPGRVHPVGDDGLRESLCLTQDRHNRPFFSPAGKPSRLLTVFPGSTIQPLPIRVTSCLVRPILCQRDLAGIGRDLPP
ncbi:MAG: putative toxin-antitoxin system toxin component, PIN family [Candidatus Saccharimonas sp.]|nr:putative toxin-antitoxin system toxin component, PIN family [Planctomycetaceae bacterium]